MSSKSKTHYVCSSCGADSIRWTGQCPGCHAWNTMSEIKVASTKASRSEGYAGAAGGKHTSQRLSTVSISSNQERFATGVGELDRVLGGGFVQGEIALLGGDPGIGKSTLLLQVLAKMSLTYPSFYVSGEESLEQIALRAQRLNLDVTRIDAICTVELEDILLQLQEKRPRIAVIDSIQTIYSSQLDSAPGTVSQVRECAAGLARFAKTTGTIIVIIGHVTKDGTLAGPRVLEHIVDAVLSFEGDPQMSYRMIRAFKNRFGAIHEIGVFAMEEQGLVEVSNPSAIFLTPHKKPVHGACVVAIAEGTRPMLLEVQALVEDSATPNARRLCVGIDQNRVAMILAVLQKNTTVSCHDQNVFVNVTGGVRVGETGADLPVLLSILSSIRKKPLPDGLLAFGEIGLTGEIRVVQKGLERLTEAAKLGFTKALIPSANMPKIAPHGIEIKLVDNVEEALLAIHEWEQLA